MAGLTLEQVASAAEIIGALTIISGLIFGWFQIRVNSGRQRDTIAINLMQTFYNPTLARSVYILHALPDGVSAEELRKRGPEFEEAAMIVTTSFETMGLLVYKRIARFDLVFALAGGMMTSMHRKLELWQAAVREEQNQPSWAEWFEWFAMLAEDRKSDSPPAYVEFRNWKP